MKYTITPAQMRAAEQAAFAQGVPSLLLMEAAARRAYDALQARLPAGGRAVFLCGPGNNGGDGLAMARLLHLDGGRALVILPDAPSTPDAQANLAYLRALGVPVQPDLSADAQPDVIVDALFGTGFHGEIDAGSAAGRLIAWANCQGCPILSVDIPSGLDSLSGQAAGLCMHASETVTFHAAKRGLLLARPELTGRITVADIGLPQGNEGLPCAEAADLPCLLPPRAPSVHKGDCGRVVLFAGSEGMAGAAIMAAQAALRAGAGLTTVICPRTILPVIQSAAPSAMCRAAEDSPDLPADARLFGCGLAETEEAWTQILRLHDDATPEVWDAGALNLLARQPLKLGANVILTPHVGEAARLLGVSPAEVSDDLPAAARALQQKFGCFIVLKSFVTVLCGPGQMALHRLPAPALAKGGSGDVLAGILAALLGQGLTAWRAMQAACLWHGLAGRLAGERCGIRSTMAEDVIRCLGEAAP